MRRNFSGVKGVGTRQRGMRLGTWKGSRPSVWRSPCRRRGRGSTGQRSATRNDVKDHTWT